MQKRVTKCEKLIKEVRRNTRQVFNSEQKIIIVLEGMRGEMTVAELCRKHGISEPTYYKWNSIPEEQKNLIVELALDYPEESPRILATRIIDEQGVFISESSVYRILKAKELMQESEYRFLSASNEFHTKTRFYE